MYIIGNAETSSHVPMWAQVIYMLKRGGNIGPSLPLCCPQHPGNHDRGHDARRFCAESTRGRVLLEMRLEAGVRTRLHFQVSLATAS